MGVIGMSRRGGRDNISDSMTPTTAATSYSTHCSIVSNENPTARARRCDSAVNYRYVPSLLAQWQDTSGITRRETEIIQRNSSPSSIPGSQLACTGPRSRVFITETQEHDFQTAPQVNEVVSSPRKIEGSRQDHYNDHLDICFTNRGVGSGEQIFEKLTGLPLQTPIIISAPVPTSFYSAVKTDPPSVKHSDTTRKLDDFRNESFLNSESALRFTKSNCDGQKSISDTKFLRLPGNFNAVYNSGLICEKQRSDVEASNWTPNVELPKQFLSQVGAKGTLGPRTFEKSSMTTSSPDRNYVQSSGAPLSANSGFFFPMYGESFTIEKSPLDGVVRRNALAIGPLALHHGLPQVERKYSIDEISLRDIVLRQIAAPESNQQGANIPLIVGQYQKSIKIPIDLEIDSCSGYVVNEPCSIGNNFSSMKKYIAKARRRKKKVGAGCLRC